MPAIERTFLAKLLFGACLTAGLLASGCEKKYPEQPEAEARIQKLASLYIRYPSRNQGKTPTSVADLKKFIKGLNPVELEGQKIDPNDLDPLFTSPRDDKPYGFNFKVKGGGVPGVDGTAPMIIYEQNGVDGKRYVASALARIEEIDEAEFQKRLAAAK